MLDTQVVEAVLELEKRVKEFEKRALEAEGLVTELVSALFWL